MLETPQAIWSMLMYTSLPGAFGGIAGFLLAVNRDHYRNNRYMVKFLTELIGATLTATFLAIFIGDFVNQEKYLMTIAFVVGLAWGSIVQAFRAWITGMVEAFLGVEVDR